MGRKVRARGLTKTETRVNDRPQKKVATKQKRKKKKAVKALQFKTDDKVTITNAAGTKLSLHEIQQKVFTVKISRVSKKGRIVIKSEDGKRVSIAPSCLKKLPYKRQYPVLKVGTKVMLLSKHGIL